MGETADPPDVSQLNGVLSGVGVEAARSRGDGRPVKKELLERPLTNRFREALSYAFELHREQPRKGTQIAYVAHLLSVAGLALEHGATEDEAIAALLHDAVEDQGGAPTATAIRQRFGDTVADIVEACSDTDETPKPT